MGKSTIRRFCKDCGQNRPFEKQTPNHLLHLIVSIFTVGIWIPFWILAGICSAFTHYRCTFCGKGRL